MRKLDFLENLISLYGILREKTIFPSISYVKNEQKLATTHKTEQNRSKAERQFAQQFAKPRENLLQFAQPCKNSLFQLLEFVHHHRHADDGGAGIGNGLSQEHAFQFKVVRQNKQERNQ